MKRIPRRHGYPPDEQERATRTVLEHAEALSEAWAAWATGATDRPTASGSSTRRHAEPDRALRPAG